MLKVSECQLCGRYYRTGKIRLLAEKVLDSEKVLSLGKSGKPKEISRFNSKRLLVCKECYKRIEKGEGVAKNDTGGFWDDERVEPFNLREKKSEKVVKLEGDATDAALSAKEKADGDVPHKKRGRKPKSNLEVLFVEAKATPPEPEKPVEQNPEHEALKDRVRQILAENGDILYSEISTRLGIDEGIIAGICDEIDKEKV
jgi:hypothetical protein